MKAQDAIARANELRLNAFTDEQKSRWIYELEVDVAEMMGTELPEFTIPYKNDLLMPERHEGVYVKYLIAMIDYYNNESKLYANDFEIFNEAMHEARSWWIRNNKPKPKGGWRV